jgi:hypothetical protein
MFRALLAHLQEALHKQQSVYSVRITVCMLAVARNEVELDHFHSNPGSSRQLFVQRLLKMSK